MPALDYFERLGLPRRFAIDSTQVEREYLARSRELHPDFHHNHSAAEQQASLELTAALNQAYVTLRDPFRRAEYLAGLWGTPSAAHDKNMDQAFLMEMMELRESMEEARGNATATEALREDLSARQEHLIEQLGMQFQAIESQTDSPPPAVALSAIRTLLNQSRTVQSLMRDLEYD